MKSHCMQSSTKIGSNYSQGQGPREQSSQNNTMDNFSQNSVTPSREAILGSCRRGKKVKRFMLLIAEKRSLQSHIKSINHSILV